MMLSPTVTQLLHSNANASAMASSFFPRFHVLLLVAAVCFGSFARPALAQDDTDRKATEQRIKELRSMLEQDEDRLNRTRTQQRDASNKLKDIERQMRIREELSETYVKQQNEVLIEQDSLRTSLQLVEEDVNRLKNEYRGRAVHAYKFGRQHDLALILAAESINEMLIRIRYLKRFADQRKSKLNTIAEASAILQERRLELQRTYERNEALIEAAVGEKARLAELKDERRKVLNTLSRQERSLSSTIEERKETVAAMESQIQKLIAAEDARQAGMSTAQRRELTALSGSFEQNRGKLPWPTTGVVTEPFGETVNPVHGTRSINPGVVIGTPAAAEVFAVFDGRVISVDIMPDYGTYVMVEHGTYHTVYSNFSLLYIGKGDEVKAGQLIGRAGTEAEPKGPGIFFALFKDGSAVDPRGWLGQP